MTTPEARRVCYHKRKDCDICSFGAFAEAAMTSPEALTPLVNEQADAEGPSRAFSAMRIEVVALRDRALAREGEHAAIHGAASTNGWTYRVAALDEVLSVIDEIEELS